MENYLGQGLILAGILLITFDVLLRRFTWFLFFFLGTVFVLIGCAITFNIMTFDWHWTSIRNIILFSMLLAFLWKPLQFLQSIMKASYSDSELHQKEFILDADVNITSKLEYRHAGVNWKVRSIEPLLQGTLVKIERIEFGVLWVSAIS